MGDMGRKLPQIHVNRRVLTTGVLCVCQVPSCSVMFNSLQPYELQPTRLICPWDSPGKNTGVSCHALLQGIFLTQGSNLHLLRLLHRQAGSLHYRHQIEKSNKLVSGANNLSRGCSKTSLFMVSNGSESLDTKGLVGMRREF